MGRIMKTLAHALCDKGPRLLSHLLLESEVHGETKNVKEFSYQDLSVVASPFGHMGMEH